jgi:hypothetical protein
VLEWSCVHWKKVTDITKEKEEIKKERLGKKQNTERNHSAKLVGGCKKIRLYPNREDRYRPEQRLSTNL